MTVEEIYEILESKPFYQEDEMKKFIFSQNSIHIDRRAFIPFNIYKEKDEFYLDPDTPITREKELRIEVRNTGLINLYGKESGEKLITLNEYK